MVRIDLNSFETSWNLGDIYDWCSQHIAPQTGQNADADEPMEDNCYDHHYWARGDGWSHHYVRTTLAPADDQRYLYECVLPSCKLPDRHAERGSTQSMGLYYEAMYLEFDNVANAVMFKLAISGT
jgi:hypothetical protein